MCSALSKRRAVKARLYSSSKYRFLALAKQATAVQRRSACPSADAIKKKSHPVTWSTTNVKNNTASPDIGNPSSLKRGSTPIAGSHDNVPRAL